MTELYLTIDDSPSHRMDDLVDYLELKNIPAVFFCRGDLLEQNSASHLRALQKGFVIANHGYAHARASEKDFSWIVADIERCESLIDDLYTLARVPRRGRAFRFPHIDRGAGAWVLDYDLVDPDLRAETMAVFMGGLNAGSSLRPPASAFEKMARIQLYLANRRYANPFVDLTPPFAKDKGFRSAVDCLYTFSNCDWMLTSRHLGRWPYQSVEDLINRAHQDPYLLKPGNRGVLLAHDQAEIVDITIKLVDDLHKSGVTFLSI